MAKVMKGKGASGFAASARGGPGGGETRSAEQPPGKKKRPVPGRAAPAARRKPRRPLDGAAILELDRRFILRPWTSTAEPVPIVRGRGLYVWDADGRRYMDFASGYFVNVAGHCHPRVMAAAKRQLGLVTQATMRNITPPAALLAEKLVTLGLRRPGKLFYAVGGSEANEWGLKMARCRGGRPDVLALENAFHGLTLGALAACSSAAYRKTAYHPLPGTIHFAPPPYCYRCRQKPQDCDLDCARKLDRVVLDAAASGTPVGSFLFEPVQSVGGIIPPDRWYDEVKAIIARHGLLLIADEVQTGLGRTGRLFACEHWGLLPDVLTVAKGISGGVGSLGAAMAVDDVTAGFQGGTIPTGSGNAVSCAAGLALLEAVEKDDLAGNAARMGVRLTERILMLDNRYVGDVRFKGLMGGVELVEDRTTKEPLSKGAMARIKEEMFRRGVIVTTSGPLGNVVRIQPPLTISAAQVDAFVAKLDEAVYTARTS